MCDTPYYKRIDGILEEVPLPCGKCPPCKMRRVNDWVFRMEQEDRVSLGSLFVTLTYDTKHVPITRKGYMTLDKRDFQLFMKRLRKLSDNKLKYYACGEYGTQTNRPHYHAIIFNTTDHDSINEAWGLGQVHIGTVGGSSIAYTTKYIDKQKRIPMHKNDDRLREFSLMSKGLGKSYLNDENVAWHKSDVSRNYIVKEGGYKIALPKYYRDRIYTDDEKLIQRNNIVSQKNQELKQKKEHIKKKFGDRMSLTEQLHHEKIARYNRFYSQNKKVRK